MTRGPVTVGEGAAVASAFACSPASRRALIQSSTAPTLVYVTLALFLRG